MGKPPKELESRPELREQLGFLWGLFVSLKNASEGAISYNQIKSYMDIYGDLTAFEVDLIRELDQLSFQEAHKNG
ncbi:MAG: phage tail assembly chaperone [Rhodospirillales bacterium]